jgi:hypothetical protein
MQSSSIIQQVSLDLNDQIPGYEYTRWTQVQLQNYLQEAITQASQVYGDAFVKQVVVKLEPGTNYQKACDCSTVVRVIGQSDADGKVLKLLYRQEDTEKTLDWPGKSCCPPNSKQFWLTGYSVPATTSENGAFNVFPKPPYGQDTYVLIECIKVPEIGEDFNAPDLLVPALKQWMLFRALLVDMENNPAIVAIAKEHEKEFWKILSADVAVLNRLKKGKSNAGSLQSVQAAPSE